MNIETGYIGLGAADLRAPSWGAVFRDPGVGPLHGLYPMERDELAPFCWTGTRFTLGLARNARFLTLDACQPAGNATLRISTGGNRGEIPLAAGWERYDIALPADVATSVDFEVSRPFEAPGDGRQLGIMLRQVAVHDDARRHDLNLRRLANAALNAAEYRAGATVLELIPPLLRLTLEVRCNIADKEPCVYCSWSWAKGEEAGAPSLTGDAVREFGPFLDLARQVNDCSYGEPPLNRHFADITGILSAEGREFSFTSNGQPLGRRIREALLGRQILLYVSIDSATARGYARYRDDRFEQILENLRALCRDKRAHDDLPLVTASFIVMNSNKGEIGDFLRCMKEVGVDRVYLRALWPEDCLDKRRHERDGFIFDYDAELIEMTELRRIGDEAKRQAQAIGIWTLIEWDSFVAEQSMQSSNADAPLCSEPWKTIYALNRGITPCCYGRKPFAYWSERGERSIPEFLRDVFNGRAYRELRQELAAGRLGSYCRQSPNCPIVRREMQSEASKPDPS